MCPKPYVSSEKCALRYKYIHLQQRFLRLGLLVVFIMFVGLAPSQVTTLAQQDLSAGCSELNDPYYDAFYGASNNRYPPYTYKVGERIIIKAGPPDQFNPTEIALFDNSQDSKQVATASYPGTLTYVIPTSGSSSFGWRVTNANATFAVSCEPSIPDPIIFIPGIAGSRLVDITDDKSTELWFGIGAAALPYGADREQLSLYPNSKGAGRSIIATDVTRYVIEATNAHKLYGPLLEFLTKHNYVEYDVHNNPQLRGSKCKSIEDQQARKPTLFVFAYDWRQDNAANAKLLADYVTCVRSYYPNNKVVLLAHSMGGLIARRYILDKANPPIRALITMGSPWLGAPKAIYTSETGDLDVPIVFNSTIKSMIGSFNGASQLLPSQAYYDLATAGGLPLPFREEGWDVNGINGDTEVYSYQDLVNMLDKRYGRKDDGADFRPGTVGKNFHDSQGQDNWSTTTDTIPYYHLVGIQNEDTTIGQVVARHQFVCYDPEPDATDQTPICVRQAVFHPIPDSGDGTVPRLSASRMIGGNYNAPQGQVFEFSDNDGESVAHTDLPSNSKIQQKIIDILSKIDNPVSVAAVTAKQQSAEEASRPINYLSLYGIDAVTVRDQLGNSTEPLTQTSDVLGTVPGVNTLQIGDHSWYVSLSQTKVYTVTFQAGKEPIAIDVRVGTAAKIERHISYPGVHIPGANAELIFMMSDPPQLRYDSNGDGVMDQIIAPTVDMQGTLATDQVPPEITGVFKYDNGAMHLDLNVMDKDNAIASVLYSQDGSHFKRYAEPITVATTSNTQITVIATDTAGNQANHIFTTMLYQVYTPYVSR